MSAHFAHKGENMKLTEFMVNTTDSGSVMLAKATPAVGLVGASQLETAQEHLVPLIEMPWSEFAAMCATIYTVLMISEWLWKKYVAFRAWRKARIIVGG